MVGGRRRKNAKRKTAPATKVDEVPDEVLGLIYLRLTSPRDLVRAAFTCKRWRQVIAGDGFRVLCSLHGAPSSHVVGRYYVGVGEGHSLRRPGPDPVFVPSSSPWEDILAARNLSLDFLPRTQYGDYHWELTDVRGDLLLLVLFDDPHQNSSVSCLAVCDPLARRYMRIPPSAWFRGCSCMGAFLLDGEDAGTPMPISLSNFSVTCVLYRNGIAKACVFSPAGGGRWTSGTTRGSTTTCGDDYWTATGLPRFAGSTEMSAYWTVPNGPNGVLALDKEAGELSLSVLPDALRGKRHAQEYAYELPWPPTIRACLS